MITLLVSLTEGEALEIVEEPPLGWNVEEAAVQA